MGSPGAGDNKGVNRARDWLEQARHNLRHAQGSLGLGDYAWACFAAQQAAEAALNRAKRITRDQAAKVLDKYYIPTRYPDAHPAGPAARHYTRLEAEEALDLAQKILAFVEEKL